MVVVVWEEEEGVAVVVVSAVGDEDASVARVRRKRRVETGAARTCRDGAANGRRRVSVRNIVVVVWLVVGGWSSLGELATGPLELELLRLCSLSIGKFQTAFPIRRCQLRKVVGARQNNLPAPPAHPVPLPNPGLAWTCK